MHSRLALALFRVCFGLFGCGRDDAMRRHKKKQNKKSSEHEIKCKKKEARKSPKRAATVDDFIKLKSQFHFAFSRAIKVFFPLEAPPISLLVLTPRPRPRPDMIMNLRANKSLMSSLK
jgi:hypothetical protein